MRRNMFHSQQVKFRSLLKTGLTLGLGLVMAGLPMLAMARVTFNSPPARGVPGRREGAGTRDVCARRVDNMTNRSSFPVALVPTNNLGLTTLERPTFFWYLPNTTARSARFVLEDGQGNKQYETVFPISGQAGVINTTLPMSVSPLETGKMYRWRFSLFCAPNAEMTPLRGGVQRVQLEPKVITQLEKATNLKDRTAIYASAGIWYETLMGLAELRRQNPNDLELVSDWSGVLEAVRLGSIANAPLMPCCQISTNPQTPVGAAEPQLTPGKPEVLMPL